MNVSHTLHHSKKKNHIQRMQIWILPSLLPCQIQKVLEKLLLVFHHIEWDGFSNFCT